MAKWIRTFVTASESGPLTQKLRAVPFTATQAQARKAYDDYHQSSALSYAPSAPVSRESFLPFWAVSCKAYISIKSANVGFDHRIRAYNPHTKRWESHTETVWRSVGPGLPSWEMGFSPDETDMQIYASYEYRRSYVNGIRGPHSFKGAQKLTSDMVESPNGGLRGLEEFRMRPAVAVVFAKEAVHKQAMVDADVILKRMYQADRTMSINLETVFLRFGMAPVYVPAFIFTSSYLNVELRTFVHGSTLRTGGQKLYRPDLVALGAAATAAAIVWFWELSSSIWTGIILPAAIAWLGTYCYPFVALSFRDWMRVREMKKHAWVYGQWEEDYVHAYESWEEYAREQDREEYTRYTKSQSGTRKRKGTINQYGAADPLGYYAALGVPPTASTAEIRAAFRALALKYHPDRFQDPNEKNKAKVKFQKISAAYGVLKESSKRKQYDLTGQVP